MNKILLIDKGISSIHDLRKSLEDKGIVLISEQDIGKILARLKEERIDMIAIDSSLSKEVLSSKNFMRLAEGIPKMVLMKKDAASGNSLWLRDESAFPVQEPVTLKELNCWIKKLTAVRQSRDENRYLSAGLIARKNEFSFFEDITKIFNSASELKKDLVSIIEKVKALTAAGDWALLLNDEPMFEIIPLKFSKKIQKYVFSKNAGISSQVMEAGVPLNIPDVSHDSRFNKSSDNFSGLKIRSMLCVPLKIRNRSVGVLMLVNKKGDVPFIENDMNLAMSTAGLAAMAIERAFLYQKIKYDELTNLYNATYLREAIDMEIQRAERYGSLFSIIFMDIDDFKKVNDKFGHLFGSRVLIEMAQLLQENLRKIDVITRYGGDEYVMILPQTSQQISITVAERLRRIIEKNVFLKSSGYHIRLTASFGIASYPDNAGTREELLKIADDAMYHGKFLTKNIVYTPK